MDDIPGSPPRVTPPTWQRVAWALTMIALVVSAVLLSGSSWEILAYTAVAVSFVLVAWFARNRAAGSDRRDARR
jgi:uncharacterized membrane protein